MLRQRPNRQVPLSVYSHPLPHFDMHRQMPKIPFRFRQMERTAVPRHSMIIDIHSSPQRLLTRWPFPWCPIPRIPSWVFCRQRRPRNCLAWSQIRYDPSWYRHWECSRHEMSSWWKPSWHFHATRDATWLWHGQRHRRINLRTTMDPNANTSLDIDCREQRVHKRSGKKEMERQFFLRLVRPWPFVECPIRNENFLPRTNGVVLEKIHTSRQFPWRSVHWVQWAFHSTRACRVAMPAVPISVGRPMAMPK
mmetsp:Transcript_11119/g.25757  ORF Transcript_11119/g.25757 Transcript_11119/m.25757 type:complete len:250 (+) Transcript_11119:107-856(+)